MWCSEAIMWIETQAMKNAMHNRRWRESNHLIYPKTRNYFISLWYLLPFFTTRLITGCLSLSPGWTKTNAILILNLIQPLVIIILNIFDYSNGRDWASGMTLLHVLRPRNVSLVHWRNFEDEWARGQSLWRHRRVSVLVTPSRILLTVNYFVLYL